MNVIFPKCLVGNPFCRHFCITAEEYNLALVLVSLKSSSASNSLAHSRSLSNFCKWLTNWKVLSGRMESNDFCPISRVRDPWKAYMSQNDPLRQGCKKDTYGPGQSCIRNNGKYWSQKVRLWHSSFIKTMKIKMAACLRTHVFASNKVPQTEYLNCGLSHRSSFP